MSCKEPNESMTETKCAYWSGWWYG